MELAAAAKLPHTSGSFGGEIRPVKHVRIIENWLTDRLHDTGSANSLNQLTGGSIPANWYSWMAASTRGWKNAARGAV